MDARPVCQGLCSPTANMHQWSSYGRHFDFWSLPFSDIDECMNSTVCGPESKCTNTPGSFICACNGGWAATDRKEEPRQESNICIGKQGRENPPQRKTWGLSLCLMKHLICLCIKMLLNVWSFRRSAGQTPTAPIWLGPTTVPATAVTDWTTWKR